MGAVHTFTGGLRLSLGSARENGRLGRVLSERSSRHRTAKRAADPRSAARCASRLPRGRRSSRRRDGARETQGEPSTTNRSGQSAALVMPIRGVTTTAGGARRPATHRSTRPAHRQPVLVPGDAERLTELARARSRAGGRRRPPRRSRIVVEPLHRLERAEQHRARLARRRRRPGWRTSACRRRGRRTRCRPDRTAPRSARGGGCGTRATPGRRSPGRPRSRRSGRRSARRPAWRPRSRPAARGRPSSAGRAKNETGSVAARPVPLTPPSSWPALAVASRGGAAGSASSPPSGGAGAAAAAAAAFLRGARGRAGFRRAGSLSTAGSSSMATAPTGSAGASICTTPMSGTSPAAERRAGAAAEADAQSLAVVAPARRLGAGLGRRAGDRQLLGIRRPQWRRPSGAGAAMAGTPEVRCGETS